MYIHFSSDSGNRTSQSHRRLFRAKKPTSRTGDRVFLQGPAQTKEPMGHRKVYLGEVRPHGLDFGRLSALNSSIQFGPTENLFKPGTG